MSSALAIASVTAVLKNLLDNGFIDDQVTSSVGHVMVTALAPDLIPLEKNATSQLNLFLYEVTPNQGWRNVGLPSRSADGERLSNPPLALDLHYLLTAYASRDLHAEILLGYAMQILHETPVLPRAAIRRVLAQPGLVADSPDMLPPELEALGASELAEQVEAIKVTPAVFSSDELSKLWSAFQSRYRPSAAYLASVVLIEAKRSTRSPLPVRAPRFYPAPFAAPAIDRVLHEETPGGLAVPGPVLARQRLVIRGRGLRGPITTVRIGGVSPPNITELTDRQIIADIPPELRAGIQTVQISHERPMGDPPTPHTGESSNLAAFVLAPEITAPVTSPAPGVVRVTVAPPVDPAQRVVLLLNELVPQASPGDETRPRSYSFQPPRLPLSSPPGPLPVVDVPITGVPAGTYLVRLSVDGAPSPLGTDASGAFNSPTVSLP